MTKKGKKKKQQAAAAATSEEGSKKLQQQSVQQQQEKAEQTSQALPGPSRVSPGSSQTSPGSSQTSGSSQQVVWGPQKQQSQSQQQQQQKLQDQLQKVALGPQKQQSQSQQQQQKLQVQSQQVAQQQQTTWGSQQPVSQGQLQQQQVPQTWGPQQQQVQSQLQQRTAWGSQQSVSQGQLQQHQVPQTRGPQQQQVPQTWGPQQQIQQRTAWGSQQSVSQGQLQQHQVPQTRGPQQQQVPQTWGPQQQIQQRTAWGSQQSVSQGQLQQHQVPQTALGPGQQQQIPQSQIQQQVASGLSQQQVLAWGSQQVSQSQPQRQQAQQPQQQVSRTAWGPQQSVSQGQLQQQQVPQTWGPQQQQQIPQSQLQQRTAWGSQQSVSQGQLQQHQVPQTALGPGQQQQIPQSQLQQQVASGLPKQQVSAWGSQQQVPQSQLQQQQAQQPQQQVPQKAWGPRQQLSQTPQQKEVRGQSQQQAVQQQQQRASIDIGAAGDRRQVQAVSMHQQQPSTSTKSPNVSKVGLIDPFHSEVTEKGKMTSEQIAYYYDMIPKRANPETAGSLGIKMNVLTNMFKIIFDKNFVTNATHYDVSIQPKGATKKDNKEFKLPKTLCRNIFEQCREKHFNKRYPAYDGKKNAYSANNLPIIDDILSDTFEHPNPNGRINIYQITIKKVSVVDLSWIKNLRPGGGRGDQSALQVLDVIMRHAAESQYLNVGRSLFWKEKENPYELDDGLVARCGGFMSGALGWKPYLNVDVSYKGFTKQLGVLEYINEVLQKTRRPVNFENIMRDIKIQSFLKGLKVHYEIPNCQSSKRTYRIIKLSQNDCKSTFTQDLDNGEKQIITIENYFRVQKRYRIQNPSLPTLHVNTKADGSEILLPIELCTIMPDQPIKRLNEIQTANMIKLAATNAFARKAKIEDAFTKIFEGTDRDRGLDLENRAMTQEFRFSVSNEMEKVPARVLSAPNLKYGTKTVQVRRGTWNLQPFKQAKDLNDGSWTIVNLSEDRAIKDDQLQQFKDIFQQIASEFGMNIGKASTPFRSFFVRDLNDKILTEYFYNNKTLKLIIVIIPNRTDVMYGNVKKITEIDVGVLTQCMKSRTLINILNGKNIPALKNILLKINSKLNGVNHIFDKMPSCLNERYPCMLVGADVTHPSPDSKDIPSIAAVAASRDTSAFRYNVSLRLQQPKEEMIVDMYNIICSQLKSYKEEAKCLPKRLVYYRDGVSEGQLPQVICHEVMRIKDAIHTIAGARNRIEVTCIVVQKRHHVRLFPMKEADTDDRRNYNVKVGTIVDTTITHPDHIDFYLVSHASIQGTARPTKYRCIYNESNFTEDQLEEMTYYLCHIYARCARSVSYPAPTYYAHLAAYRGRTLIQGNKINLNDLRREQQNFEIKMDKSPMYFV